MILTKFHENRLVFDGEIHEKHALHWLVVARGIDISGMQRVFT